MATIVEAVYDGSVLRPAEPLALHPNTRVRLSIEELGEDAGIRTASFLRTAMSMKLSGPSDWSTRVDDYLYDQGRSHGS